MRLARVGVALVLACIAACGGPRIVALRPQRWPPSAPPGPLHVIASLDGAADPLPLKGEGAAFAGVAATLGEIIAEATSAWAARHHGDRPGGWEMHVHLLQSRAEAVHGRVTVELASRVTLSTTLGQVYLAQTHGYCLQTDVLATEPTATVYACMESMAHDVAGWLEGVSP